MRSSQRPSERREGAVRRGPEPKAGEKVRVEISAGGIVFKRTPKGVRLAFIMDPYGKWAFAKGHVDNGEAVQDGAVRETKEEMGLRNLRVVAPLGTIDFWFRDRYRAETKGVLIHKYVHYFLMQTPAGAYGKPQRTEKIRKIIWVPLRRAHETSSYDDVRPILDKAIAQLSRDRRDAPARPAGITKESPPRTESLRRPDASRRPSSPRAAPEQRRQTPSYPVMPAAPTDLKLD